jgi:hypothetical protein
MHKRLKTDNRLRLKTFILVFSLSLDLTSQVNLNADFFSEQETKDIIAEYILQVDSAFRLKHRILEIVCTENLVVDGKTKYDEPIIIYRFDESGKRTHVEFRNRGKWGESARYTDYNSDSIISVTYEKHIYETSTAESYYISRTHIIDDTLSHSVEYVIHNDSLYQRIDRGVYDSKAILREARKRWTVTQDADNVPLIENPSSCLIPYKKQTDPPAVVESDSLGRVIKILKNRFVQTDTLS